MVELAEIGVDSAEVIFDLVEACIHIDVDLVETGTHLSTQLLDVAAAEENPGEDGDKRDADGYDVMHSFSILT